jgi:rhodanese-related sulfurtransferase
MHVAVMTAMIALLAIPPIHSEPSPPLREHEVELRTALEWGESVIWVDVREREQFDKEHIPGAIPMGSGDWEEGLAALLEAWQPESKTVVYCDAKDCELSKNIADRLRTEAGLENIYYLRGGWPAWKHVKR